MNLLEYLKIYKEQKGIAQRTLKDKRSKLQAKNKQVENREISVINEKIAKLEAQLEELKTKRANALKEINTAYKMHEHDLFDEYLSSAPFQNLETICNLQKISNDDICVMLGKKTNSEWEWEYIKEQNAIVFTDTSNKRLECAILLQSTDSPKAYSGFSKINWIELFFNSDSRWGGSMVVTYYNDKNVSPLKMSIPPIIEECIQERLEELQTPEIVVAASKTNKGISK